MFTLIVIVLFVLPLGVVLHGFSVNALIFASMLFGIQFCRNLVVKHFV